MSGKTENQLLEEIQEQKISLTSKSSKKSAVNTCCENLRGYSLQNRDVAD